MEKRPPNEVILNAAELISLPIAENEIEPVAERLGVLLDASDQIAHLIENTAELDVRFNASWEAYPV